MNKKQDQATDKFWPALPYPLSLADALSTLTKQQLTSIRMNLEISNLSTLNKQGLVEKLAERIPEYLQLTTRCWDHDRMKLVQKIAKNGGLWDKPLLEIHQYEYFRERGILFPGKLKGKRVAIMPSGLVELFRDGELFQDHTILSRNTEWIRMTRGLLNYYGTLSFDDLTSFLITEGDHPLAQFDMMNILYDASYYYEQIEIREHGWLTDYRAVNPAFILKERSLRQGLDFRPFTKQELLKAGEPDYYERNRHYVNLVRYVLNRYEMDHEEADLFVQECVDATKNGDSLGSLMELAQEFIELPSLEMMAELTDLLVPLMNSTRQWAIKGYSPEELSAKRARANVLLNTAPKQADVIHIQTKTKVGRNDPCPCRSGKKFKKCCG
ncbi:YecA family protein [Paenibacillus sp. sgz302251]|uniref:YecA family protein n=1 Tax=Paenibacillus sp. sgz302251 TaxID=3414493 RepID=UPI003C7E8160